MPARGGILFSCALHLAVVALFFLHLPFFTRSLPEETPIVVELVNIAPETRATEKVETPPQPKKPDAVAQKEAPPPPKPEPPKPEPPKPEPPKPEPPKPPPPKPEVKPAPPKPPQKDQDVAFDALLKTLAKRQAADNSPPDKAKPSPPPPRAASSQPIAPLGPQLSTSEIDLVRQQIERCWVPPAGARDAKDLTPEFRVSMNHDGTVRSADLMNGRSDDPFFQAAADSARRALLNANCHGPLKLPPEKFDLWQTFTITFDPKDIT
jgi:outer membrane biosynthesis protein TonB